MLVRTDQQSNYLYFVNYSFKLIICADFSKSLANVVSHLSFYQHIKVVDKLVKYLGNKFWVIFAELGLKNLAT